MDVAVSTQRTLLETPGAVMLIDAADLIDTVSMEIHGFERLLAACVRLRRSHGYLLSPWTTAVSAATFDTGDEIVEQLEQLAGTAPPPVSENSARAASAVRHHRVDDAMTFVTSSS